MVATMDYITDEILNKGDIKILTSPEIVQIQVIIEDSLISESSLPTEEYTGYTQISAEWFPYKLALDSPTHTSNVTLQESSPAPRISLQLHASQDHPYKSRKLQQKQHFKQLKWLV